MIVSRTATPYTREQVELPAVLDQPPGRRQLVVDQHPGVLLRRQPRVPVHSVHISETA
ncbi:MAG: hypothetical protein ACRDRI_26455 [Pseudonocardiaceae bacterium]